MIRPWPDIAEAYRDPPPEWPAPFRDAFLAIGGLAEHVAATPLSDVLFGWTSMHDLCIQPAPWRPYTGPHLRLAPLPSGSIAFDYLDTAVEARRWRREVDAAGVIPRLDGFLGQLGWV